MDKIKPIQSIDITNNNTRPSTHQDTTKHKLVGFDEILRKAIEEGMAAEDCND